MDRKLSNNKFMWCFHKAKQVYYIHHANVQRTYDLEIDYVRRVYVVTSTRTARNISTI